MALQSAMLIDRMVGLSLFVYAKMEEKASLLKWHNISMLCSSCSKLQILYTNKTCMKCQGNVQQNISILCEACSSTSKSCSACLRKIYRGLSNPIYNARGGGCKSCGGRK